MLQRILRLLLLLLPVSLSPLTLFSQSIHKVSVGLASDLPLVIINTFGRTIPDKPRIIAHMGIIENTHGELILPTDGLTDYDGRISVEERGHSSRFLFPEGKHSLGLETQDSLGKNNNVSILGMPKENDWILNGPYSDKTLIRNAIVFSFGRDAGLLAPRNRFVNLIINGVPKGLFVWMEKIKEDKNRVDLAKLTEKDTAGDQLTGGYIVKIDWPNNVPNEGWKSPYPPNNGTGQQTVFVMQDPKPEEILPVQLNYIREYITAFETALRSENYRDPVEGYRKYIDIDSWVNFFLVSELFRDTDAYRCSLYMYKDLDSKGGKLTMGPLWDYNYSMGNYENCQVSSPEGWAYLFNYECNERAKINPFWFERLMEDEDFVNRVRTRWEFLRQEILSTERILDFIDQTVDTIARSANANFEIWPVLNTYLWPNAYVGGSYENEISWLKNWLTQRALWIDANLPGRITDGIYTDIRSDQSHIYVYPNPFGSIVTIQVQVSTPGQVHAKLINVLGKEIAILSSGEEGTGTHTITWSSTTNLPSGLYFARIYQDNRQLGVVRLVKNNE